jgi:hypothetical protein
MRFLCDQSILAFLTEPRRWSAVIGEGFAVSRGSGLPSRREPGRSCYWANSPAGAMRHEPKGTQGPTSWTPARPTIDPPLALGREDTDRRTQHRPAISPAAFSSRRPSGEGAA